MRLQIWKVTWLNLSLLGHGAGSFEGLIFMSSPTNLLHPEYAHNDFLQLAFEFGLGAAIPVGILLLALRQVSSPEWPILATALFMATFSFPLYMPVTAFIAALCTGRLVSDLGVSWYRRGDRRRGFVLRSDSSKAPTDNPRSELVPV